MTKSERFRALSWIANLGLQAQARHDMDEHLARGCVFDSDSMPYVAVVADRFYRGPGDYVGEPSWRIEYNRRTVVAHVTEERFAISMARSLSAGIMIARGLYS